MLLHTQSAVTEPFSDFSVDTGLSTLGLTRTYSSADWSYSGGPAGVFGRGWHHDWEAWLTCTGEGCTVARGLQRALTFRYSGTAASLDGQETWWIYTAAAQAGHHDVLARRPNGEWIVYSSDGSEQHFAVTCDACGAAEDDVFCRDPAAGGKARLVKVVSATGNEVTVTYGRPQGLLLGVADGLGHSLEIRSTSGCGTGLATSLVYDGITVATYAYQGLDLDRATDPDGHVLRSYGYDPASERLLVVQNEAGDAIASFAYDEQTRAVGIVDKSSSVWIDYSVPGSPAVSEFFGETSSTSVRTLGRDGTVAAISAGCACGPARTYRWVNRQLQCSADTEGHVTWQDLDAQGRVTRRVEYSSALGCPASSPTSLDPLQSRQETMTYGLSRSIAQGVSLPLDVVATRSHVGVSVRTFLETLSYDPSPQAIDPAGYACQEAALLPGSVVCRRIERGSTQSEYGSWVWERHAIFYSYDARGRLTRTLGPVNLDRPGANEVTPLEVRTYWPDSEPLPRRGRLRQVMRYASPSATPLVTGYDYDAFGAYLVTQPNGSVSLIVKDGRGRPAVFVDPDGSTQITRYHDGLDPAVQVTASGSAVRFGYDGVGRLAGVEHLSADPDLAGAQASLAWGEYYTYDTAGNRTRTERRNGNGAVTYQQDLTYDVQHRVVSESNPEAPGSARTRVFDAAGSLSSSTDEDGRSTLLGVDALRRVSQVTRAGLDASGNPTSLTVAAYSYDRDGNLAQVTDGRGGSTTHVYDDFGRLMTLSGPNLTAGPVRFLYDARGNVAQRKDLYSTITYAYDGLDRLLNVTAEERSVPNPTLIFTYGYDAPPYQGMLTSVTEADRTVSYQYDTTGRVQQETRLEIGVGAALVTSYAYDADGALAEVIYPSGLHLRLTRDPAGQIVQMSDVNSGVVFAGNVTHLPGGPVTGLTFGNGLTLAQAFNLRMEPGGVSSGPLVQAYAMTAAGDVGAITEGAVARIFEYDFLDRLKGSPDWLSYAYDGGGNRTEETFDLTGGVYSYVAGTDRLARRSRTSGTSLVPSHGFGYDSYGRVSGIAAFDLAGSAFTAAVCWTRDALGRLSAVGPLSTQGLSTSAFAGGVACASGPSQVVARFKYDHAGRRVARYLAATNLWTHVVSDGSGQPLSELALVNGAWIPLRDYVWLDGQPLAQIDYFGSTSATYYYHVDHLGMPRALTNASQQTVWSALRRPYGDIDETAGADPATGRTVVTNLRLPGQYDERLLGPLGLQGPYYNWNRWYLPGVGRYLEPDPIALAGEFNGEWGPDWYGYALDNPLRWFDPSGTQVPCLPGESSISCKCKQPGGSWACIPPANDPMPKPKPQPPAPAPSRPPAPQPLPKPDDCNPKDKCYEDYKYCANSPLGSMYSYQFGHSQCQICLEQCIQENGVWPVLSRLTGKRCI